MLAELIKRQFGGLQPLRLKHETIAVRGCKLLRSFFGVFVKLSQVTLVVARGKSGPALGGTDAISVPADSAREIVRFTISIPRESCTNAKAKYSSSVVPPGPSVHFYHWS